MAEAWIGGLLGPVGLVCGMVIAVWAFATDRVVSGMALRRSIEQNEALLEQNAGLLRQNEALQRRIERLTSVTGKAFGVTDTART